MVQSQVTAPDMTRVSLSPERCPYPEANGNEISNSEMADDQKRQDDPSLMARRSYPGPRGGNFIVQEREKSLWCNAREDWGGPKMIPGTHSGSPVTLSSPSLVASRGRW